MIQRLVCLLTLLFSLSSPAMERKADFWHLSFAAKNVTVIGHLPDYVRVAEEMGANYLKPVANWNWRIQADFIKRVIARGDDVFIGTAIREGPSVLKHEIKQLVKAGYRLAEQGGKWLIKGGQ